MEAHELQVVAPEVLDYIRGMVDGGNPEYRGIAEALLLGESGVFVWPDEEMGDQWCLVWDGDGQFTSIPLGLVCTDKSWM